MGSARRSWGIGAAALMLLLAACGGGEQSASGDDGANLPGEGETIRINVGGWLNSAVNANVAKIVLEQELGYDVELVEVDAQAAWPATAAGEIDAILEVWKDQHSENYATYIEGGAGAVDGGDLGVIGTTGWYVPSYLLDEYPELKTWEGIKGNEEIFQTAESGNQGQFLGGDASWTSYDKQIIENLGLDLKEVLAGSEAALLSAVDSATSRKDPLLFYFYSPQWAHERYELTEVELPEVDAECEQMIDEGDLSSYDCGYPDDTIIKVLWEGLEEKAPEAFTVLSNMNYSNEDQQSIAYLVESEGMDVAEAAQQWIDENEDAWQAWLP